MLERETIEEEDYTFDLVPVQINFESTVSSYYSTAIYVEAEVLPYLVTPAVGQLNFDKARVQLIFSRLQVNQ